MVAKRLFGLGDIRRALSARRKNYVSKALQRGGNERASRCRYSIGDTTTEKRWHARARLSVRALADRWQSGVRARLRSYARFFGASWETGAGHHWEAESAVRIAFFMHPPP
jgi:hypothetical protein